jgi:hypothetical protein
MKRWLWFALCAVLGLLLALGGLLVPVHLRALESRVLARAGGKGRSLPYEGLVLLDQSQVGPAELLLLAARSQNIPESHRLGLAVGNFAMTHPRLLRWGGPYPALDRIFPAGDSPEEAGSVPILPFLLRLENRTALLDSLRSSEDPSVRVVLRGRQLTNTVLFPPSASSAGQALDTALALAALLVKQQQLAPAFRESLTTSAREAVDGGNSQRFEQALLDLASLGQRFNYAQLSSFVAQIQDTETLRHLARLARQAEAQLPILFSAVLLSEKPAAVAAYLMEFSQTGLKDLGLSLRSGAGGLREVLQCKLRVYEGGRTRSLVRYNPFGAFYDLALDYGWLMPRFAMAVKWLFYLAGGLLLAGALHFARPPDTPLERPLHVAGFPLARELLFALGFLVVVLLLSEPFLAQDSQKVDFPFRLRLPMVGAAVLPGIVRANPSLMNQLSLLTLLLFFVLQGLIYTACLVKVAEIRRQNVAPRLKLKLLENEDHLFDAGLYLGFVGTIISLILVSLGVIKPSLMAAYSSTSFGIIFVSILKIFHVRPLRRNLILESEREASLS